MKKKQIVYIAAIMLLMSSTVIAQEETKQDQRPKFDRTELIQKRTDDMVKKYGLSEEQAQQLLSLNTKYAEKMRGPRGQRPQARRGEQDANGNRSLRPRQGHPQGGNEMKAYDEELQKILTPDQYKAFSEDRAKRMRGRGHGFGQHPARPQVRQ